MNEIADNGFPASKMMVTDKRKIQEKVIQINFGGTKSYSCNKILQLWWENLANNSMPAI